MSPSSGISRVGWYDERGRGLMMIAALTDEFELSSNEPGTTLRMVRAATLH